MQRLVLRTAQITFFAMLVILTFLALADSGTPGVISAIIKWDKAEHFLAYLAVGMVGTVAFPRLPIMVLFLALLTQSAILEAAQPYFGRTRDIYDLLASAAGMASLALSYIAGMLRDWLVKPREGDLIVPAELVTHGLMSKR